jgi:hypothetical protein
LGPVSAATENGPRDVDTGKRDGQSFKPSPPNPQATDRAAAALLAALVADQHSKQADAKFRSLAGGVDRGRIVRYAGMRAQLRLRSRLSPGQIEAELWRQVERIFSAKSLARLEPRGSA